MYDALNLSTYSGNLDPEQQGFDPSSKLSQRFIRRKHADETARDFAMLKMRLRQAHEEKGTKVIAITSAVAGEGKTTITHRLSILLSQSANEYSEKSNNNHNSKGHGILVIDGNLTRPSLQRMFKTPAIPGLTDFAHDELQNRIYIRSLSNHSLCLITSGRENGADPDIWNLDKMNKLFSRLRESYEYIIIDAPPVLGHPETIELCRLTDGALMVIKANKTRVQTVKQAKEELESGSITLLGAVLNKRRFFIPRMIYRRTMY